VSFSRLVRAGALALALVAACAVRAAGADPYDLNALLPLTGNQAAAGQPILAALKALESGTNKDGGIRGRPIRIVAADTQSSPQVALQLANTLLAKGVPLIIGPVDLNSCNAVAPLISKTAGPIMYCASGGLRTDDNPFLFAALPSESFITAGLNYFRAKKLNRIALLTLVDATGQLTDRAVDEYFAGPEHGAQMLVDREHFNVTDLSVTAQLERIRTARPDAIVVGASGVSLGTVLRGVQDTGLQDVPLQVSTGNANLVLLHRFAALIPKELLIPAYSVLAPTKITDRTTMTRLRRMSDLLAPDKPDEVQVLMFDPTSLLVEALRSVGTGATAAELRGYLAKQTRLYGVAGPYNFVAHPGRGLDVSAVYMVRWDGTRGEYAAVSKAGGTP
jgi:branched-chain amino acid transport system substrate-binding protein